MGTRFEDAGEDSLAEDAVAEADVLAFLRSAETDVPSFSIKKEKGKFRAVRRGAVLSRGVAILVFCAITFIVGVLISDISRRKNSLLLAFCNDCNAAYDPRFESTLSLLSAQLARIDVLSRGLEGSKALLQRRRLERRRLEEVLSIKRSAAPHQISSEDEAAFLLAVTGKEGRRNGEWTVKTATLNELLLGIARPSSWQDFVFNFNSFIQRRLTELELAQGALRDRWRTQLATVLTFRFTVASRALGQVKALLSDFSQDRFKEMDHHEQDASLIRHLASSVDAALTSQWERFNSASEAAAFRPTAASFAGVKIGLSSALNKRQLEWERRLGEAVRNLRGLKVLRSLVDETDEELAAAAKAKEEILAVSEAVRGTRSARRGNIPAPSFSSFSSSSSSNSNSQEELDWEAQAFLSLLRRADPKLQSAARFSVSHFRPVDKEEEDSAVQSVVEFEVIESLGVSNGAAVLRVRPVSAFLRKNRKIEDLAAKVLAPTAHTADSLAFYLAKNKEAVLNETNILAELRRPGETLLDVQRRTGIVAAHFVGHLPIRTKDSISDIFGNTLVLSPEVTFTPVLRGDLVRLFSSKYSMETRVYIARRLLRSVAALHSAGFCHSDLKLENAGVTAEGDVVIFDCEGVALPGEERDTYTATNFAPESVLEASRGHPVLSSFEGDSWGLGVMLHTLFTGELPFVADPGLMDKFLIQDLAEKAAELRNIDAPAFALRRNLVPPLWELIIALLLQKDPKYRPTPLQILEAFPQLAGGVETEKAPTVKGAFQARSSTEEIGLSQEEQTPPHEYTASRTNEGNTSLMSTAESEKQFA